MAEHTHKITGENEKKTFWVIVFTIVTMVAEIVYGYVTHSMALLADGYHMGTHAVALSLTLIAYILIRKFEGSKLFPSGTEKIGVLAAYTSSLVLGFTGIWIIVESVQRFINPLEIGFNDAILVAVIGLAVNAICIYIMEGSHHHKHSHADGEKSEDYNFKAAYYHILADALTSVLAIIALLVGKYLGILCLDPIIGILGGILIIRWAVGLLRSTVVKLIDMRI